MTKYNLTTTELKIIKSEDEDRTFMFTVGVVATAIVAYIRIGDVGDADFALRKAGRTMISFMVPKGRPVFAWTDAGTAELFVAMQCACVRIAPT